VIPTIREHHHLGITENQTVVERGTPVYISSGKIGTVDHVLMGQMSHLLTHLIVARGPFKQTIIVPKSMIKEVNHEGIIVKAEEETLEMLSQYIQRPEKDILADFQKRVNALGIDQQVIETEVRQGVFQLSGVVSDVATKRCLESAARSVEGVIDVENHLATHTAIVARITSALEEDPRTELAVIEVINEYGLVTLKGQVDNQEISATAEKIAQQQPGVISVINALKIDPDEATTYLRYRHLFGRPYKPAG
jgi:hypothetical protein